MDYQHKVDEAYFRLRVARRKAGERMALLEKAGALTPQKMGEIADALRRAEAEYKTAVWAVLDRAAKGPSKNARRHKRRREREERAEDAKAFTPRIKTSSIYNGATEVRQRVRPPSWAEGRCF